MGRHRLLRLRGSARIGLGGRTSPLNYLVVSGVPVVTTQTSNAVAYFGQGFLTGTIYVGPPLNGYRQSTTSLNTLFNPVVPTGLTIGLDQQLLNGFGYRANAKFIRIAQNNLKVSGIACSANRSSRPSPRCSTSIWCSFLSRRTWRVANQALAYSEKLLADNKLQVSIRNAGAD